MFGEAADTYDDARPDYPVEVIDLIVIDEPTSAVDVGCGTGKAARKVIERGVAVLGIEPDARMAAVARRHGIEVVCSQFEDWEPTHHECVFSAQAWHWIDPVSGAWKAAEVLPTGGRWTAVWNNEDDDRLTGALLGAYSRFAPHLIDERRATTTREAALVERTEGGLLATAAFGPLQRHDVAWTDKLSVGALVDRLSTHSAHRLLPTTDARRLHDAVADDLGGLDARINLDYTTMVLTTCRR